MKQWFITTNYGNIISKCQRRLIPNIPNDISTKMISVNLDISYLSSKMWQYVDNQTKDWKMGAFQFLALYGYNYSISD